ncbi:ABC transporter ATP-binding protein [Microbulbifer elongatus]|uniref:ATP-binding cassette domain-containing protein n=1 Tax=Microbulbifer elongatus TaxID=86173 RepID=UPI001CFD630F|nr:ABC transporter ATP-binding protein [Microbulbifer elongatus]
MRSERIDIPGFSQAERAQLQACCWPRHQLDQALAELARHAGLNTTDSAEHRGTQAPPAQGDDIGSWLQQEAQALDLQAETVSCSYREVDQLLQKSAPAILRLEFAGEEHFLAIAAGHRRQLTILTPAQGALAVPRALVAAQLVEAIEAPERARIAQLLNGVEVSDRRRARATRALLRENLAARSIEGCWLLRLPARRPFRQQLRHHGLYGKFAALLACHIAQVGLFLASWWVIGRALLSGHIDAGWLAAWVLLLASQIPLALLTSRLQGAIAIDTGTLMKKRLLASALRMAPDRVRRLGSGQILSRVFDAEHIEADALQGGFLLLLGAIELAMAVPVLLLGSGGPLHLLTLPLFVLVIGLLVQRQIRRRRTWTGQRLALTHSLIEKMVGHRTRLAQQPPADWHRGEDRDLDNYQQGSAAMDSGMAQLLALLPRTWLILGIAGCIPVFISGNTPSTQLAVAIGGVLLGYRALLKALHGFTSALNALVAWENVRELFALEPAPGAPAPTAATAATAAGASASAAPAQPLCYLRDLRFHYPGTDKPALQGCSLTIRRGDRLLLQGSSGSGKSTLAALVTGIHTQDDGLLLLNGYDRASLGEHQWRRLVASAPQFHENHVIAESFLFNLLMGDYWPPTQDGLRRAYAICDELGLTPLLQKMPAGMLQTVGEMGWQLSHGEKSRLFIARALLQNAELVVLDESFAALDPASLRRAVACVQKHASTLLVIAHP